MSDERCPITELIVAECAHCRAGLTIFACRPTGRTRKTRSLAIEARYAGRCGECRDEFDVGDLIVPLDPGWAHEECKP